MMSKDSVTPPLLVNHPTGSDLLRWGNTQTDPLPTDRGGGLSNYLNPRGLIDWRLFVRDGGQVLGSSSTVQIMSYPFFLDNLVRDFRYAVRTLRKDLRFAFVAVFALTLGIAATTVVFSVFYNMLFNAVAAKDTQRPVVPVIENTDHPDYSARLFISWPDYQSE